jgi:hypothetical protein
LFCSVFSMGPAYTRMWCPLCGVFHNSYQSCCPPFGLVNACSLITRFVSTEFHNTSPPWSLSNVVTPPTRSLSDTLPIWGLLWAPSNVGTPMTPSNEESFMIPLQFGVVHYEVWPLPLWGLLWPLPIQCGVTCDPSPFCCPVSPVPVRTLPWSLPIYGLMWLFSIVRALMTPFQYGAFSDSSLVWGPPWLFINALIEF